MSKGSSKVRAADSQGGYIYTYVYMFQIQGGKKKSFFLCPFFFPGLSSDQCTQVLCVYCNNSVHCEFQLKNVVTQHQKFNIPDQILNGKFPPFPYHRTQLLQQQASELTRGMRVEKNQRESEQENERASEREGERARARGECERKTSLTRKNEHDKPENEREEGSELYTKSLL